MSGHGTAWVRTSTRRLWLAALATVAIALAAAPAAQAERALLPPLGLQYSKVPGGQIEGACGLAVSGTTLYVSDYYHHAVDIFNLNSKTYQSQIAGDPLDGPCQLAISAGGALYANNWHQGVSRLLPSRFDFEPFEPSDAPLESTGVEVDQATGNVYVDDRSYVAVYEPSGAPLLKIGLGTLGEGFGLAVAGGRVYVADAADSTVKVYEPAVDATNPALVIDGAATPQGGFNSLVDATVAIDPTSGHLLVIDNLQPGFEHPEAAIDEFETNGTFLGQVSKKFVDGGPSGLAFGAGILYVTTGNSEESEVLAFGPYVSFSALQQPPAAPQGAATAAAGPAAVSAAAAGVAAQLAEVTRESYTAKVEPICKANTQANEKIFKGVKQEVKAGKLKPAATQFAKAASALKKTIAQLKAVPQPPADGARLDKWLGYVEEEAELFSSTSKKLKAGDKIGLGDGRSPYPHRERRQRSGPRLRIRLLSLRHLEIHLRCQVAKRKSACWRPCSSCSPSPAWRTPRWSSAARSGSASTAS